MGKAVKYNLECPDCGSSRGYTIYADGSTFCFSCRVAHRPEREQRMTELKPAPPKRDSTDNMARNVVEKIYKVAAPMMSWPERKITEPVLKKYEVLCKDSIVYIPIYSAKGKLIAYRARHRSKKEIKLYTVAGADHLIGRHLFPAGGRMIVITEGAEDMLSIQQAYYDKYKRFLPVVSVLSASSKKTIIEAREYLRSFEKVVMWFDDDEPGRKLAEEASKIIGYDKVYDVHDTGYKDASDMFRESGKDAVINTVYGARKYAPSGVADASSLWSRYEEAKEVTYIKWPDQFEQLNAMTRGRTLGSITVLAAGTGLGKSSFVREDIYHIITNTNYKVGVISLEESAEETIRGLLSLHLNKRLADPDIAKTVTKEEEQAAFIDLFQPDRVYIMDHHGDVGGGTLIDKIEYMAAIGCHMIYLDHITIAIGRMEEKDELKAADKLMQEILHIVQKYRIWMMVVSHLRKSSASGGREKEGGSFERGAVPTEDDLKGSGSLKQISYLTIALSRNKMDDDEVARRTTKIWVLKDRLLGSTGYAGSVIYDPATGRLRKL